MKYILTEQQVDSLPGNVLFVRYKLWDNSKTVKKLPYSGTSAWAVKKKDLNKLIGFFDDIKLLYPHMGGGSENLEIINPAGKKVIALDYKKSNDYVMGDSNEKPEIEQFDPNKHTLKFKLSYQNPYNERDKGYTPIKEYQVLIQ